MEEKSTTSNLVAAVPVANAANNHQNGSGKNKKKKSAFRILKAAMLMLRTRPTQKLKPKLPIEIDKNENWKKIVGSMRPLHLQDQPPLSPPPLPPRAGVVGAALPSIRSFDNFEDVYSLPSPAHSTVSGSTSQYASANNLQELDKSEDNEVRDAMFDDKAGDAMIDAKADEFISQFYEQMRLQNSNAKCQ
ncbi:hypothetical protein LguiA_020231 [Lonicera macranthoides]